MNVDNYGWESSLSMVANEQTRTARPRPPGVPTLLRPVFMNAVEVGYSYAHCDRDKKLNVRGVTIALWHFICRGHQAIALLPYCFKNYAEKSTRYSELMMLYRLNLIEFTPGYGSEKYTEVNRIMVNRAFETGGCLVARSQMQGITDNKPHLVDVVEKRLLMPTFNGDDIMFPIDGPLGRNGPSLEQTLQCEQGSKDWRSCSEHQLLVSDQRHWLEKLALLVPEKVVWTRMVQMIQAGGSLDPFASLTDQSFDIHEPPMIPSPPIENPFSRTAPSNTSIKNEQSIINPYQSTYGNTLPPSDSYNHGALHHLPNPHQLHQHRRRHSSASSRRYHNSGYVGYNGGRHQSSTRLLIRYGSAPPEVVMEGRRDSADVFYGIGGGDGSEALASLQKISKHSTNSVESSDSTQSGEQETNSSPSVETDEEVARELNEQLIEETQKEEKKEEDQKRNDEVLAQLSQIFGYKKSFRVMSKYPNVGTFALLVEKCIQEPDQVGDSGEFSDVWPSESEDVIRESPKGAADFMEDLIDFSDEPLPIISCLDMEVEEPLVPIESNSFIDLMF